MKAKSILFLIFIILFKTSLIAQVTLSVRINSGNSGTSCTDGFLGGAPEPQWRVDVGGQGYTTYPTAGICYTNPPNTQFSEVYNCASSYPSTLQVCFRAFEDDGASCTPSESCLTQICQNFATPAAGSSVTYNLTIPNCCGNASWGTVNFTFTATGSFLGNGNNLICNAVNLGALNFNSSVGNNGLSNYTNICGTNDSDPNPWGGTNNQGVWFKFTTSSNPSAVIDFLSNSDPQGIGNGIDLQLALYKSSNNLCSGALTLVAEGYDGSGLLENENMSVTCLLPNTTYFLLVDGESDLVNPNGQEGFFGLRINDNGIQQAIADAPANVTACDTYTLAPLTVGNYFTGTGGTGTAKFAGDVITSSQTMFVYAQTGTTPNCTDENSFSIAINTSPNADAPSNVTACDSYTLPALTVGNYFTGTGGTGTAMFAGDVITSSQTMFVYAQSGTTPNCTDENSFSITINTISTGTDTRTECNTYTWINGTTYTASNNTATHTILGGAANGCDSMVTLNLTINNITDTSTSLNGAAISANNNSATYLWLDCDNNYFVIPGETSQTFTATSNGNYAVQLTENGCIDTSACVSVFSTGIVENDFGSKLRIYPNPNNGKFSIDLGAIYDNIEIAIYDLGGRLIENKSYNDAQTLQLSVNEPNGIYILTIVSDEKKAVIRLVKE